MVYVTEGENNKPIFKLIELGTTSGNIVQVMSGLTSGDRVFISPPQNITIEGVDTVHFN